MERIQEFKIDLPIFLDFSRKSNLASQTVQKIFMVTSTNSFHHMVSKVSISYKGITESRSSLPQHSFRSSNLSSHRHQVQKLLCLKCHTKVQLISVPKHSQYILICTDITYIIVNVPSLVHICLLFIQIF